MAEKYKKGTRDKKSLVGKKIYEEFSTLFWLNPGMFLWKIFFHIYLLTQSNLQNYPSINNITRVLEKVGQAHLPLQNNLSTP
jgi:hypothetical protein